MVRPWHLEVKSKFAWILMVLTVLAGTVFAANTHPTHERSSPAANQQMGTTCLYTAGPKASAMDDYAPTQMPVNTACNDGAGSTGLIIPMGSAQTQQMGTVCKFTTGPKAGQTQDYSPMHAPVMTACKDGSGDAGVIIASPPKEEAVSRQTGTVCKFTTGPRAGATQDYAPMESPLGMSCTDGEGSSGTIIDSSSPTDSPANSSTGSRSDSQTGTVCKFTAGPKAGTTQDYAPMHFPLNTSCDDDAGSSGVIVAPTPTGTVCRFTAGPKAGATHDYAPMHFPLNTPCDDGAGSSGMIVVPAPTGTVCKFTAGPKAGTTRDYAPMHAPLNTACDDGAGSSGMIVAPTPTGSVCKFTAGPKAGTTQDYAPMHAPLNTACDDGAGSNGVIVATPSAVATPPAAATPPAVATPPKASSPATLPPTPAASSSTALSSTAPSPNAGAPAPHVLQAGLGSICKLTSGPKAGTFYNLSPAQGDLGAPCNYGPENTGFVVANAGPSNAAAEPASSQKGTRSACKLTSGPKTGYIFGPMQGDLGAPCNDGHGSHGFIIEH